MAVEKNMDVMIPTASSFNNFFQMESKFLEPLAIFCTTMDEDWTPTFPAVAAIRGIKKAFIPIKGQKLSSLCGTTQIDDKSSTRFVY